MSDSAPRKAVKVGVREGSGPPPGYNWNVDILDQAFKEAKSFLDDDQYQHMALQVQELARQDDPKHSQSIDVRPVEDLHEVRDKGGILGRLNVRIFYFVHDPSRTIVILGAIKKESDGPTPMGDKKRMQRRMRVYRGGFGPET
jgi:mRNA-degrading endonuclease RelE of RelBE toxin-antitoxin system